MMIASISFLRQIKPSVCLCARRTTFFLFTMHGRLYIIISAHARIILLHFSFFLLTCNRNNPSAFFFFLFSREIHTPYNIYFADPPSLPGYSSTANERKKSPASASTSRFTPRQPAKPGGELCLHQTNKINPPFLAGANKGRRHV